jgi:tetratricopeptide (TPR) repeat protein
MTDELIERAVRLHGDALLALQEGALARAGALALEALDLFERASGLFHPDVANVLTCLAHVHAQRADYDQAEQCGRRAVTIMRRVRMEVEGPDLDRLYVQALTALGDVVRILGRYEEAEAYLREATSIAEAALGPEDDDCLTGVNSLAVLYKYSGRFDDAAALYQRALQSAERAGAGDEAIATLLHNIGGLEHARGAFASGEPAARRSVELRERALGPDHPAVAADVATLAALVDAQGRHDEAEAMYVRALTTFERVYGPDHYEIAINLNNLAGVHHAKGRSDDAEALYRRALTIKEKLLGMEHPDVALTLNNLGLLLDAVGRGGEAEPLFERALRIFVARLVPGHPKIVACASNYAALLHARGRPAAARAIEGQYVDNAEC